MSWQGKKVLVTGAGGFIGSHLAERLVQEGARVSALVHYNSLGRRGWLDHSRLADEMDITAGDICDRVCVVNSCQNAEVIFHLAALIGIPYSYLAPESYVSTNLSGTLNILQTARELGTPLVVHTSTSEVYGTARKVPIDESHPLQGQSPYSATKIAADKMAEAYHLSFDLPVVTVRPFNTYGPRQSARAVIPTIISQCLAGGEVHLGNLSPTRDLNYVANTVDGYLAAAQCPAAIGQTINLGSGKEISIGALAQLIADLCDAKANIVEEKERIRPEGSEVERLLADASLAKGLLGWEPRISLSEGLQKTIAWIKENQGIYRTGVYTV